jgi:hypothetical protein
MPKRKISVQFVELQGCLGGRFRIFLDTFYVGERLALSFDNASLVPVCHYDNNL